MNFILAWTVLGFLLGAFVVFRFQQDRHYDVKTLWLLMVPLTIARHIIAWPFMVLYVWPSEEWRKVIFGRLAK